MKIFSFVLLTVFLILLSCAGGPGVGEQAPDWASSPLEDSESVRAFRGSGVGDNSGAAKNAAVDNLRSEILTAMDIESSEAFNSMFEEIADMIDNPEADGVEGVEIIHNEGWKNAGGSVSYIVDITWDNVAFEKQKTYFEELGQTAGSGYRDLEIRAGDAETDGNFYEAALIWAAAAGTALNNADNASYRKALDGVLNALDNLDFELLSYPDNVLVGLRPELPVVFQILSRDKPVSNAEFAITYPKNNRDGSSAWGQAFVSSDDNGLVHFLPPEVPFAGPQYVSIAPSANPFLEYLGGVENGSSEKLIRDLEKPRLQAEYEASSRLRTIPTGILILETDLAGNALKTADTAKGLLDDLSADGFNIAIMDLDSSQMLSRTDEALLRDLKADVRYSDKYQRVVYGTVALDSFEQKGGSYTVKVSGTLVLADINRQITLYKSEITKSSQASSSLQAISAAFRQLGRSFAGELISQAP